MTAAEKARSTIKSEQTRQRILRAALELFQSEGFDGTTMRDIARKAGVATGAAYYYFQSKDSLVLEFYRQLQDSTFDAVTAEVMRKKELKTMRRRASAPNITSAAQGVELQTFCGAVSSRSMPSAAMSTQTAPEATQSSTNSPPCSCTAAAT